VTDYIFVLNLYVALRRTESSKTLWLRRGSLFWGVQEPAEEVQGSGAQGKAENGKVEGNQLGA